ncbi:hypothetical protein [Streptomyces antimycoticus]|uniref:hypothetical protein n=1 Tax=Streptomyces antimycoticus TaxID=68175 RepID=UPI002570BA2A|nr:hypothetical protein [Streptomyces antimycoticus]WJE01807.1 hypothetical protein QR300_41095 [Streptomyces antimycoticus]
MAGTRRAVGRSGSRGGIAGARAWLGLPGLVEGGAADLVAYDTDPTLDSSVLAHPSRIIPRGRVIA